MQTNDLARWLSVIETLHPKTIDMGLERVGCVAAAMGVKRFDCPVITIAGTNGKGSCVALLEAMLLAAGYRVAAYTSPHLYQFNERYRVDGQVVGDQKICDAFNAIDQSRKDISLSYFEFSTLAALYIFAAENLDVILLEVGLGGRLDATNIVDPTIAVITSIDIDHTDYLGTDRESIGKEKAGILRESMPVVCGDPNPPSTILNQSDKLSSPLYCVGKDFSYQENGETWSWQSGDTAFHDLPKPNLLLANAATALMVTQLLPDKCRVDGPAIIKGLSNASLPGRFQRLPTECEVVLDVAHNPAAAKVLAKQLTAYPCVGRTFAVVGMLSDKDIVGSLTPLTPLIDQWYLAPLDAPRSAGIPELQAALKGRIERRACYTCVSISEAYRRALLDAGPDDRIIVFGSFHTVAAIKQ